MTGSDGFDYGRLMQRALRGLMAEVLGRVAEEGLPGDHHLLIGVDTTHPGVDMPDWLRERYPQQVNITIQYEYYDLAVMADRFSVGVSFSDQMATLVVPFDAVRTFIDPSVEFGLKFEAHESEEEPELAPVPEEPEAPVQEGSAEVVSLDTFRKT